MLKTMTSVLFAPTALVLGLILVTADAGASSHSPGEAADPVKVEKDLSEAVTAVKNYASNQSQEAYDAAVEALETADRYIERQQDRLSASWDTMTQEARATARDALHEIRKKRNAAGEWLGSMKTASADAWGDVKNSFTEAYDDLSAALTESEKAAEKSGS